MAWSEEPNVTNWFKDFLGSFKNPFGGGGYVSPDAEKYESNAKKLQERVSAPGYRAPLGESGSVVSELITGKRANEMSAPAPGGGNALQRGLNSFPWQQPQATPEFDLSGSGNTDSGSDMAAEILARLGQNFSFDRGGVDTSAFDEALAARMGVIDKAKGTANTNFAESDSNLEGMHNAFEKQVRGQAPALGKEFDNSASQISGAFDGTVQENRDDQANYNSSREEMLSRLGIAPAANQPDVVNEAFTKTMGRAQEGEDIRLAENAVNRTGALERNTGFADSIGAAGVERRSDLNSQLQDILGKLEGQGADYQAQAAEGKMNYLNGQEDKSYQRFLQDRNFDMGMLSEVNSNNRGIASDQAKADAEMRKLEMESANGSNQVQGFDGLISQTPPAVQQAIMSMYSKMDIDAEPQKAYQRLAKEYPELAPEFFKYFNKRATLGNTNKFDVQ